MSYLLKRMPSTASNSTKLSVTLSQRSLSDIDASSELSSVIFSSTPRNSRNTPRPVLPKGNYSPSQSQKSASTNDSGISEDDSFQILERGELQQQCDELMTALRTVAYLTDDFRKDVLKQVSTDRELLAEMDFKIRPSLIKLDEEISQLTVLVRKNLDRCKITDAKINWLLHFNCYVLEFQRIVNVLNTDVFDELEKALRLRARGCVTIDTKQQHICRQLLTILNCLNELEKRKSLLITLE